MARTATKDRPGFHPGRPILAVLLGATAGLFVSGYWLIDHFPVKSRQLVLLTTLISVAAGYIYFVALRLIARGLAALNPLRKVTSLGIATLVGMLLLFAGTSQWTKGGRYVAFLLPRYNFHISAVGVPQGAKLVWLSTSLGDVSFDLISMKGWVREGDALVLQDPRANALDWESAPGSQLKIVLQATPPQGEARLTWEGGEQRIPLDARSVEFEQEFPVPWYSSTAFVLLLGVINLAVVSLVIVLSVRRPTESGNFSADGGKVASSLTWTRDAVIMGAAIVLALLLRIFNLDALYPAVDEYYHLIAAGQILQGAPLASVYPRGLWVVTLPVASALRIFGHEVWAARAIGVVFNSLAIVPLYLLTRKINREVATIACVLFATSPWIITFSRVAREYAYYPFYFYWIVLAMVSFAQRIPAGFVVRSQWRAVLNWKSMLLVAFLAFPPVFALSIDWLSTFRTVLIAYLVFGALLMTRFNWRDRPNWPYLGLAAGVVLLGAWAGYREQLSKLLLIPRVNPVPIAYFFPNPRQQWYFDRIVVVMAAALILATYGSLLLRNKNTLPLFFVGLFAAYLGVFAFFSKTFFHTRHLMSTEFWYVIVAAMGLYWLWELARRLLPWRSLMASAAVGVILAACVMNPRQILLPTTSTEPDMPISEDYMHDMSSIQAYMLDHAQPEDVLVATVYGLYAQWEGKPEFSAQYRITSHTTEEELLAILAEHPSGWIVIDDIRLDLSPLGIRDVTNLPRIEYIGVFGDENLWRWK